MITDRIKLSRFKFRLESSTVKKKREPVINPTHNLMQLRVLCDRRAMQYGGVPMGYNQPGPEVFAQTMYQQPEPVSMETQKYNKAAEFVTLFSGEPDA